MPPVPFSPGRRSLLAGLGALAAAPALLAVGGSAPAGAVAPSARSAAAPAEPVYECLADLIESGEVTRADLMAR